MDDYQCCTLQDAPVIADKLRRGECVIFGYQGTVSSHGIYIGPPIVPFGVLPHGGQPYHRYYVGIIYAGFFHFDFSESIFPSYIGEKLRLPEEDAIDITVILNEVIRCIKSK